MPCSLLLEMAQSLGSKFLFLPPSSDQARAWTWGEARSPIASGARSELWVKPNKQINKDMHLTHCFYTYKLFKGPSKCSWKTGIKNKFIWVQRLLKSVHMRDLWKSSYKMYIKNQIQISIAFWSWVNLPFPAIFPRPVVKYPHSSWLHLVTILGFCTSKWRH